jgi:hypothetical protein
VYRGSGRTVERECDKGYNLAGNRDRDHMLEHLTVTGRLGRSGKAAETYRGRGHIL